MRIEQQDDAKKGRFIIYEDDQKAGEITYTWARDTKFIIDHTEVNKAFSGKGLAKKLVLSAADFARKNEIKIVPLCPYAKHVFEKEKELQDLVV
ncbi:GNAT family N-acetyltransferase [Christiangramia salexigens]|uniref:GNAT family N-acetyltransferase n=1 Tax=Christiangramia salexigens TaxID=1913577 RepID=A0A1L3J8D6_9FLAO|nr:GNAT family N-acetyltransferase [Christiangramia salexigens]